MKELEIYFTDDAGKTTLIFCTDAKIWGDNTTPSTKLDIKRETIKRSLKMKEFEKQWKCGMLSGSPSSFNSGASVKEAAQFNWRAALEWVLTHDYHDMDYEIREELKS